MTLGSPDVIILVTGQNLFFKNFDIKVIMSSKVF